MISHMVGFRLGFLMVIIFQTATFVNSQAFWSWEPNTASARAASKIVSCDINNDMFTDMIITGTQSVYILYGNSSGGYRDVADQVITITTSPGNVVDGLGVECADLNSDGYSEVIVGNWTNNPSRVHIYNGTATGVLTTPTTITYSGTNAYFGYAIASSDFNGDGFKDLAVGAYGDGDVYIYYSMGSGGLNTTAVHYPVLKPAVFTFGQVLTVCDFSHDGYPDLVVSTKSFSGSLTNQGQVSVISGTAAGFVSPAVTVTNGTAASAYYGSDTACGDINGDGNKDLLVLSTNTDRRLFIYYGTGNVSTLPKTPSLMMNLTDDPRSLECTDINGDGMDDILVGYNTMNRVRLYYGSQNLITTQPAAYIYNGVAGGTGWSLAALGNLDSYGQAEYAVGTYQATNGQTYEGRVTIVYNLPASPSPTPTPSRTPSNTPTPSVTPSITPTSSITPTVTPSNSPTSSVTPSTSRTPSPSVTPTVSPTPSVTSSVSPTPSITPSASPSTNYLIKNQGSSKDAVVMSVAITVPIMSCTILAGIALVLFFRNKNKRRNIEVELPGRPDEEGSNYVIMKTNSSFTTSSDSASDSTSIDRKSLNMSLVDHDWDIPYGELRTVKVIGTGAFGQVFKARWQGVDVAVKQILTKTEQEEIPDIKIQDFFAEAELMRKLKPHPNITQLLGVCMFPLCIVTEFVENGSLFAWIQSGKSMDAEMKMNIIKGTAAGMLHLHSQGVIHRDLAARNILLDSALRPKVCDFGMSRIALDNRTNKTDNAIGPIKWMAPEALTDRKYNTKTDVWSFGVVIYEILARKSPYHEYNLMQIGTNVALGKLTLLNMLENPDSHPAVAVSVFRKCLDFAADNRPEFKDIIQELDS